MHTLDRVIVGEIRVGRGFVFHRESRPSMYHNGYLHNGRLWGNVGICGYDLGQGWERNISVEGAVEINFY